VALLRGSTLLESLPLEGWSLARSTASRPDELDAAAFCAFDGPATTVAALLRRRGEWELGAARAFDEETWWMRCDVPPIGGEAAVLALGGLATLADVFLAGEHVLRSDNMFHAHRLELAPGGARELAIRFAPVAAALAEKRPRPRWKTRLVAHQQLRWIRTSLVGRMPGWSPPVPPIGAWRPVVLERWSHLRVTALDVRAALEPSGDGVVTVSVRATPAQGASVESASLVVGDAVAALAVLREGGDILLAGTLAISRPALWWPHTHGAPARHPGRVLVVIGGVEHVIDLGAIAFRSIDVDTREGRFGLVVNGVPVFCRGACWTTTDVTTLTAADGDAYARVLGLVRDAGMNMVRVPGTMFYESDAFYEACDALGILVWQDFMFANMDYPAADEGFRASVEREARELLARLQARPCVAVLCGGSEVEQQAAMFGAPRGIWQGPLFTDVLPGACAAACADVPYWPNSPSGGALPFHVDAGVGHYYGVGAYLRPFDDARRSQVAFASECLALANVPEDDLFPQILPEGGAPVVHARWKERTSKDHGSGWDFEDVRDHYLALLFGVDPVRLRSSDMERYLALSRVTSGEVMARVLSELRRPGSPCRGALVWFLQDLWPGAGWGILDARGSPKSPYWFVRRALRPTALLVTDEGVNGLALHVVNDGARALTARLRVELFRDGEVKTGEGERDVVVAGRSAITALADGLLPGFADTSRAYRFGPPGHDVVVATLLDGASGEPLAEAIHLHDPARPPPCSGLEARLARGADGLVVELRSPRFAHAVSLVVAGYEPEDNYFDVRPGGSRRVRLRPGARPPGRAPSGTLSALNLPAALRLTLAEGS
jgi:beta-mannosidase